MSKTKKLKVTILKPKVTTQPESCPIRITMGYKPQVLRHERQIETLSGIYNPSMDNTYWD